MNWKRVAADAIRSGDYMIVREQLFGETAYLALHAGKTIALALDADAAKAACAAHALTVGRDVVEESATHRAREGTWER